MVADALANLTAAAHILYFTAVVAGFLVVILGPPAWRWTRGVWFRVAHLIAIAIVLVENTFGLACPLNRLEWGLRAGAPAAATTEASTGMGFVLDQVLFHTIGGNVLNGLWWAFGVLAVALWFISPPYRRARRSREASALHD
jgi:hypothetical protein